MSPKEAPAVWSPEGMSQDDFMRKDNCIAVNYLDEVIGHDNKYNCHKFLPGQPKGILHRAFSVMLFDCDGQLLLQQRASSKITFPNVWTNTCCSHPLHGMVPPEVDEPAAVKAGNPMGAKHAAVRKLRHELGIPEGQLDPARFKFMTRVHYWAADTLSHGDESPWGEHEIDYLLLYRLVKGEPLDLNPHPEEVRDVRWLGRTELQDAMAGEGPHAEDMPLWSPWFRIIAARFLDPWWQNLDEALTTNKHIDVDRVHRFDPPEVHYGGAGGALPKLDEIAAAESSVKTSNSPALKLEKAEVKSALLRRGKPAKGAEGAKQGAYGKVVTHSTSKLDQLMRPLEVMAAIRFKFLGGEKALQDTVDRSNKDVAFCIEMLDKVSRSFAVVIRQLPSGLSLDIAVFYLVLRALDTVEDDMEAYKDKEALKMEELKKFGAKRLSDPECSVTGVGEGDEKTLAERFGAVVRVYQTLPKSSQEVIRDITDKMGAGMAEYVQADLGQGTADQAAYDRYCHMVAGLVGEGLTRLFVERGFEDDALMGQGERVWPFCVDPKKEPKNLGLVNSMGLFLQTVNIIRDYLEDYVDGRAFWPQTLWKKYATTGDLGEFARPTAHGAGVQLPMQGVAGKVAAKGVGIQALCCLDEMVGVALELVPDCLEYLNRVRNPLIYRFCAIPQLMAIATLAEVFDNPLVFTGVVKVRKGATVRLIQACIDGPDAVHWWFRQYATELSEKVTSGRCAGATPEDSRGKLIVAGCARIIKTTQARAEANEARLQKNWRNGLLKAAGFMALGSSVAVAVAGRFMG
mmetsp:Transcript_3550/g.8336  ORF Transcript_3550/g.8336 Transcript_3550/m.8336 type:complete len:798 (+) Transcript_3550:65-2458(+)